MNTLIIVESDAACERIMVENNVVFGPARIVGGSRMHQVFRAHDGCMIVLTRFSGYDNPADNGYRAIVCSPDATMEEVKEVWNEVANHGYDGGESYLEAFNLPQVQNQ